MEEYKFDTQLLLDGSDLDEDEINDYITAHFAGDCLLVVGDEETIKLHFHTVGGSGIHGVPGRYLRCRHREYGASGARGARLMPTGALPPPAGRRFLPVL